jgi:DNA-binding transcriptional MerR regulator
MTETEILTIRQMCDAFGVTARALRFYEAKDLLSPIRKGAQRLYTQRERARLALILKGKRLGIALDDMRKFFGVFEPKTLDARQVEEALALAEARLAQMQDDMARLQAAMAEIRADIARFRAALAAAEPARG